MGSLSRRFLRSFAAMDTASNVFLFPGQGSQYVGMTQKLSEPLAADSLAFRAARSALDYDLLSVCLTGPKSQLDATVVCQPAVMAASLAAAETATRGKPVSECCVAAAGFSVGEITALTFAESLSMESGLQLIHERATAMQEACQLHRGTMLTVIGLSEDELNHMCTTEARTSEGGVACIANYIFPRGYVISGDVEAIQRIGARAQKSGATIKEVSVSGAFHSPLMNPAVRRITSVLDTLQISPPKVPVYSNVTGKPYSSTSEIRECLALQVTRPVLWESTVRNIKADCGKVQFCEVGPGKQLKAMLRRISKEDYKHCVNIEA